MIWLDFLSFSHRPAPHSPEGVGGQADVLKGIISEDVEGQEGQRDEAGHQPREPNRQVGVSGGGRPAGGMENQLVALQSDQHQGEDGNCHRHALDKGCHLLQTGKTTGFNY